MILERVITVEYLDPSMSRELLGKFPDASAFGFNYSESGIWSPLLPRGTALSSGKARRTKGKTATRRKKKKKKKSSRMMDVTTKKLDFSPSPTPKRGWNRLLKAAAKHFKIQRRSAMQMILPTL